MRRENVRDARARAREKDRERESDRDRGRIVCCVLLISLIDSELHNVPRGFAFYPRAGFCRAREYDCSLSLSLSLFSRASRFILLLLPFLVHVNPPCRRPEATVFY
jgi:hypothetical protein